MLTFVYMLRCEQVVLAASSVDVYFGCEFAAGAGLACNIIRDVCSYAGSCMALKIQHRPAHKEATVWSEVCA